MGGGGCDSLFFEFLFSLKFLNTQLIVISKAVKSFKSLIYFDSSS